MTIHSPLNRLELNSQVGAFAGIVSTLGIALEDFSILGRLDETTAKAIYPRLIKDAAVLSWKDKEREYAGITVPHELVRSLLAR